MGLKGREAYVSGIEADLVEQRELLVGRTQLFLPLRVVSAHRHQHVRFRYRSERRKNKYKNKKNKNNKIKKQRRGELVCILRTCSDNAADGLRVCPFVCFFLNFERAYVLTADGERRYCAGWPQNPYVSWQRCCR